MVDVRPLTRHDRAWADEVEAESWSEPVVARLGGVLLLVLVVASAQASAPTKSSAAGTRAVSAALAASDVPGTQVGVWHRYSIISPSTTFEHERMVVTPVRDNLIYSAQYDNVREQLPGFQWDSNQGYFQGADVTDSWSEPAWFPSSITDVQRVIRGQMVFVQPGVHAPSAQLLVVSCTACTALMSRPCPRLPLVCPNEWEDNRPTMRAYALTQLHDPEAIELFITEEDARRALEQCLQDEPQWRGTLEATEVELDHEHTSLN